MTTHRDARARFNHDRSVVMRAAVAKASVTATGARGRPRGRPRGFEPSPRSRVVVGDRRRFVAVVGAWSPRSVVSESSRTTTGGDGRRMRGVIGGVGGGGGARAMARAMRVGDGSGGDGKEIRRAGGSGRGKLYKLSRSSFGDDSAADAAIAVVRKVLGSESPEMTTKEWNFALRAVGYASDGAKAAALCAEVWNAMLTSMTRPDSMTLSALARGMCRHHEDVQHTLRELRRGVEAGAEMDDYVLNILLSVCSRDAKRFSGRDANERDRPQMEAIARVLEEIWNAGEGYHNEYTLTSTMRGLNACGRADKALEIFTEVAWQDRTDKTRRRVHLDSKAVVVAMECCARVRSAKQVYKIYRRAEAENKGLKFDTRDINVLLSACGRKGNVAIATEVFDMMLQTNSPPPDKASLTALILACAKVGDSETAMKYFNIGRQVGVEFDTVTVNSLLKVCSKASKPDEALEIFMDAIEQQIPLDSLTFAFLLGSFNEIASQPGQLRQALDIMNMSEFLNIEPTTATLNALLRVCVAAGDFARGREELQRAVERGVPVTPTSVAILAESLASNEDTDGALGTIRFAAKLGIEPTAGIFIQCVSACKARGDATTALTFYNVARNEFHIAPVTRLVNELFDALSRRGMWQDALRILSDDVLSSIGQTNAEIACDDMTIAHLIRALASAGELEQGAAALELGKFLTGKESKLARERLQSAIRREQDKTKSNQ